MKFFTYNKGTIKGKNGTGWGKMKQQAVLCATYVNNKLATGTFSGTLLLWKGRSISKKIEAHKGPLNAIWNRKSDGFITGGNDGNVIVWSEAFEQLNTLNIRDPSINSYIPKVRSV